jgi:hypothetical protein
VTIKAKETHTPSAQVAEAPVSTGFSSALKVKTPSKWTPSVNWPPNSTSASTAAAKKPAAASVTSPAVTSSTPAAATSTVRSAVAEPMTANPVQRFTDFVGNAYNGALPQPSHHVMAGRTRLVFPVDRSGADTAFQQP